MNYSTSEENYIKTIFHLQGKNTVVTTNALAKRLQLAKNIFVRYGS